MTIENKFTIQKSFVINAGAGSGKTYTLSRRYINALLGFDFFIENKEQKGYYSNLKPALVEEIVTLTYTEAAALEMKERIFSLIKKILNFGILDKSDNDYNSIKLAFLNLENKQREYIEKKLSESIMDISNAKISTIHSYCLNIIKRNSDIAKVDSGIDLIKDNEKINLIENVIFNVLDDKNNKEIVLELSKYLSLFKINEFVNKYLNDSNFRKNFEEFSNEKEDLYKELLLDIATPEGVNDSFNIVIDFLEKNNNKLKAKSSDYITFLEKYFENFQNFELKIWKELQKELNIKFEMKGKVLKEIKKDVDNIKKLESKSSFSAIDLKKEKIFFNTVEILKNILKQIKTKYDNELIGIKKVDFNSIIYIASKIIDKVDTNFKYFMVDEFQDTNEVQFNIIKNSLNKDTNFFVVGDSKQSIYSFQGAEIEVFNKSIKNKKLFSDIVDMDINFRSDGIVLDNINKLFVKLFTKDETIKLVRQNYEAKAQNLKVSGVDKENKGSFDFLITSNYNDKKIKNEHEFDTIAIFIKNIIDGKTQPKELTQFEEGLTHPTELKQLSSAPRSSGDFKYGHIKELIDKKEKAIAVVFDSKSKMLLLKKALNKFGIEAKVSATENFYYTKEVNDIFNVLKAINIVSYMKINREKNKNNIVNLNSTQKFYLIGAYRSNILRIKDDDIKKYIENNEIPEKLNEYCNKYKELTLSELIKFIYDESRLFDVYAYLGDIDQRIANLYKFLNLAIEFETNDKNELRIFLKILEESVYFNEVNENEAFYKSSSVESIELCTIHSTKGLAYPMVILANSDKKLNSQVVREGIKHNKLNFLIEGEDDKNMVLLGYKIDNYSPISLRILNIFNEVKHIAEKKRLFYVALTRAEHNIVISGFLKNNKPSIESNSYLDMIINSMNIDRESLYSKKIGINIDLSENELEENVDLSQNKIKQIDFKLKELNFNNKSKKSATKNETVASIEKTKYGSLIHKILEENWKSLDKSDYEMIFNKYKIIENTENIEKVKKSLDNFLNSDIYKKIKNNKKVHFELEFEDEDKKGFIDLLYFDELENYWSIIDFKTGDFSKEKEDKYLKQLEFYKKFLKSKNYKIGEVKLLWL